MAKFSANVALIHPETGVPTVFLAGQDVPDWAGDQVGDHVVASETEPDTAAKPRRRPPAAE